MRTSIDISEKSNFPSIQENGSYIQQIQQASLFLGVFEGFIDGILILTEQGKWITANSNAKRICEALIPEIPSANVVPEEILQLCESFTEQSISGSKEGIFIESNIFLDKLENFRLRAQWIRLEEKSLTYLVVIIEDRCHSLQAQVELEAKKYNLTSRESEIWLLRKANYTYQEIAAKLFITLDTVKKHMKNIYAKQKSILNIE